MEQDIVISLQCASNNLRNDATIQLAIMAGETVVGTVDFYHYEPVDMRAAIGIFIAPEYRNRGYASASIHQALMFAHSTLGLHQVYCDIDIVNRISQRLFTNLGFHAVATLSDWILSPSGYSDAVRMQYIFPSVNPV